MGWVNAWNSIDTPIVILEFIALVHTSGGIFVAFNPCFINLLQNTIFELLLVGIQATKQGRKQRIASACNFKARFCVGISCVAYCNEQLTHAIKFQINSIGCCSWDKCRFTHIRTAHNIYQIINPERCRCWDFWEAASLACCNWFSKDTT